MSKQLIITGMHRSGTSFCSAWLASCGLYIGDDLIGATESNVKGHFEDKEIVEFHEELLRCNNTNMYEHSEKSMTFNEAHVNRAKWITDKRDNAFMQWAWKQPRASLFLNLWEEVLPKAKYIFMLRHPVLVVNSILKRESNKCLSRFPGEKGQKKYDDYMENLSTHATNYTQMYIRHNKEVLDFTRRNSANWLTIDFQSFNENSQALINHMDSIWGFDLKWNDPANLFEAKLKINKTDFLLKEHPLFDQAMTQYEKLAALSLI